MNGLSLVLAILASILFFGLVYLVIKYDEIFVYFGLAVILVGVILIFYELIQDLRGN